MKTGLIFLAIVMFLIPAGEISMLGIKINDDAAKIMDINLEVIGQEINIIKFRTENGNDFSITYEYGKIVYMENDWSQDSNSTQPLFSDFSFGHTSLRDIRNKFSSNGFAYENRIFYETDSEIIVFNCFDFDSENNEVLVTITKMSFGEDLIEDDVASNLRLDALIIADINYLDKIWGENKVFDKDYKKIEP